MINLHYSIFVLVIGNGVIILDNIQLDLSNLTQGGSEKIGRIWQHPFGGHFCKLILILNTVGLDRYCKIFNSLEMYETSLVITEHFHMEKINCITVYVEWKYFFNQINCKYEQTIQLHSLSFLDMY